MQDVTDVYVALGRGRWLRTTPDKIPHAYYEGEEDKWGGVIEGSYLHHEIVVSDECPGAAMFLSNPDVPYFVGSSNGV